MNEKQIINKIASETESRFKYDSSGHDWWHIYRVWQLSKQIALTEESNLFIVELAALLHDVADWKFNNGNETVGGQEAHRIMDRLGVAPIVMKQVVEIVNHISYKGAEVEPEKLSKEGQIVQDADRLDAIGAIGIARTFAYGGFKGRAMYDPDIKPLMHQTSEAYKKNTAPTINHFYEKLLLLKDRMNTETGKRMAEERHRFMENYLDQFFKEWKIDI